MASNNHLVFCRRLRSPSPAKDEERSLMRISHQCRQLIYFFPVDPGREIGRVASQSGSSFSAQLSTVSESALTRGAPNSGRAASPVDQDADADQHGSHSGDQLHALANRATGGQNVVDEQDPVTSAQMIGSS